MTSRVRARPCQPFAGDARGVVVLEFLIAFGPLFLLFLATVQLGLIAAASLIVRHAAAAGVRAAVVVLDDEPRFYAGAPRGSLGGQADSDPSWDQRFVELLGASDAAQHAHATVHEGPRMLAIRRAVVARIAALTPDPSSLGLAGEPAGALSVGDALGAHPFARLSLGLSRYAGVTTAVTFPIAEGASTLAVEQVDQGTRITLRVTHLFACLVPIVASIMCEALAWDAQSRRLADPAHDNAALRQRTRELRLAPFADDQRRLANAGVHAWLLSAEATLPAQAARYRYASEHAEQARR